MPSSTSSSDLPVPDRPWTTLGAVALVVSLVVVAGWEAACRSWGYGPSRDDTPEFWAEHRDRAVGDALVVIGSSRVLFDLDLPTLERGMGRRPVQLAVVGSSPRPFFADLAGDESFRGTLIVGVTPNLYFVPGGPLLEKAEKWVKERSARSPSRRASATLYAPLDRRLAFLNPEDLTLGAMLRELPIANREKSAIPPRLPPYIGGLDDDRQLRMSERLARDPAFQERIKGIWKPLLQAAPPMAPEVLAKLRDQHVAESAEWVRRIRSRGGKVVFVRPPSTGWFREFEQQTVPTAGYWGELLAGTEAPGIHFEHHPSLAGFDCPEWSHLTAEDAVRYTEALVPLLKEALAGG